MQYAPGQIGLDQAKVQSFMERRKEEQSLPLALAAGVVAALVGAAIWAVITVTTQFQIGWMAVGVGFLVGYAVQYLGKGMGKEYQYVGALCALLGCLLGNYFVAVGFAAQSLHMDFFALLPRIPVEKIPSLMQDTFQPMDLLFYAIAVYEGYRFSLKRITREELSALQ
ncbi:MAG TPA: hypothetical protein VJN22_00920 [Candidatus Eremiobacteraceae bacterium]|nr:hypothetical protein [Candidatus Eremiobacteraceae bacterium]